MSAVEDPLPRNLAIVCNRFWRANCNCIASSIQSNYRMSILGFVLSVEHFDQISGMRAIFTNACTHALLPLSLSVVWAHTEHGECIPNLRHGVGDGAWCMSVCEVTVNAFKSADRWRVLLQVGANKAVWISMGTGHLVVTNRSSGNTSNTSFV